MKLALGLALLVATGAAAPPPPTLTLSILATNDLHGRFFDEDGRGGLIVLGGYLANLRQARAKDGGAVLLLDAGDALHGTLESDLGEGQATVSAMNRLGYAAMALGNHEFDYGPVGPAAAPDQPGDDAHGALKARMAESRFPWLAANLLDEATGRLPAWPNLRSSVVVEAAGLKVGVLGVVSAETLRLVTSENGRGLRLAPLAETVASEAAALRAGGCSVVVVVAHAGAGCKSLEDPDDLSSCEDGELLALARSLPPRLVDAIVGAHTHQAVAKRVNGIAVIESWSNGRGFGRVDLAVDRATGRVENAHIHQPRDLCATVYEGTQRCDAGADHGRSRVAATYEGAPVVPDAVLDRMLTPALELARVRREQRLGVRVTSRITHAYGEESPLGNLFADLMREARPSDVAITNGGGLRADLPVGELSYGQLYRACPFDNRFATFRLTGGALSRLLAANLSAQHSIFSLSGIRARARCESGRLQVDVFRENGARVAADETLTLVTSDYLAQGTEGGFADLGPGAATPGPISSETMRDGMARRLTARGGSLRAESLREPVRFEYPGRRPVTCAPAR
jgi:5'-nucleotidase